MKPKALIIASVASMIGQFNMDNIELLQKKGYGVDVIANFENGNTIPQKQVDDLRKKLVEQQVTVYHINIQRNPISIKNLLAYFEIKKIINNRKYSIIHAHSPVGGVLARLSGRNSRNKFATKIIYTAHGFHFYKGAPKKNWIIYYPVEKFCSRFTDVLITINNEDYLRSLNFHAKQVVLVPGIGIDVKKIRETKSNKYDLIERKNKNDFVICSVGELNLNKNHLVVIEALAKIRNSHIYYFIFGVGPLKRELEEIVIKEELQNQVKLLGYSTEVLSYIKSSDLFVFPSFREGLSVALMEAMACGKPVIASKIRGNTDLIDENHGGVLFDPFDYLTMADALEIMYDKFIEGNISNFGKYNIKKSLNYDKDVIKMKMANIYFERKERTNI